MFSYCTNYTATMPDVTVYMNCDTRLAINLSKFQLNKNDEFIFVIKNYNYINSSYVYIYRAKASEINTNGEILLRITPAVSKYIKPGAFYTLAVLRNAFEPTEPTEYQKLTDNGKILIEYGAQDLMVTTGSDSEVAYDDEVIGVRLEPIDDTDTNIEITSAISSVVGVRLELVEE